MVLKAEMALQVVKEEAMPDAPPSAGEDVKMEDATGGAGAEAPAPAADGGEGTAEPSADGAAPMETDSKEGPKEETEVVKKTRVKKIPIGVTAKVGGLDQQQLQVRLPFCTSVAISSHCVVPSAASHKPLPQNLEFGKLGLEAGNSIRSRS